VVVALAGTAGVARADGPPVTAEVALGTRFPLDLEIEGAVVVPLGFTARLGFGWMPHGYRNLINDAAVGLDLYDDTDAAIVEAALEDAFLITPTIGWRPPLTGLEIYAGYVFTFLGGTVTREEAEAVSGEDLRGAGVAEVPLGGSSHGFQIGLAYQVGLAPHVALRLSLAYFQIVHASAGIDLEVQGAAANAVLDRVETALDARVDELLSSYVKAPLLGVSGVWQF
jgi:hypothetical protein